HLVGANLLLLRCELLDLQLAMLLLADAVDFEILDTPVGARIEVHRRHAGQRRVVADARCAEKLREQLLLDRRRAARGDDEKDTAKDHSTRHRGFLLQLLNGGEPSRVRHGAYSSSSFSASRAIETARSSPSMSISFTP